MNNHSNRRDAFDGTVVAAGFFSAGDQIALILLEEEREGKRAGSGEGEQGDKGENKEG